MEDRASWGMGTQRWYSAAAWIIVVTVSELWLAGAVRASTWWASAFALFILGNGARSVLRARMTGVLVRGVGRVTFSNGLRRRTLSIAAITHIYRQGRHPGGTIVVQAPGRVIRLTPHLQGLGACLTLLHSANPSIVVEGP